MNATPEKLGFAPAVEDDVWRDVVETPLDDEGKAGEFLAAALLHRTTPGEIARLVEVGLRPFVYLGVKHGAVVASPVVGALLDDLREFGGRAVNALLDRAREVIPADDREGHAAYAGTLDLLARVFGSVPDARVWVSADLYNGCVPTCKYSSEYKPDRSSEFIL